MKPFVKWAGGKSQLLEPLRSYYLGELGGNFKKYAEPFVGGGAVLFDILSTCPDLKQVYISDINAELINTYKAIKMDVSSVIDLLASYQSSYREKDAEGQKEYYYIQRDEFNQLKMQEVYDCQKAALFIFLNRTCFNGLYRVNKKGLFNVPIGSYKNPLICDPANLVAVSKALQKVEIVCGDYQESARFIDNDTFVYFDPPYRPLNQTSNFTSYTQNEFGDEEQIRLANFIEPLHTTGARILLSNSDPKNTNKDDNFFDTLYKEHQINRVQASRMINSTAKARGKITELLIANF